MGESHWRKKQVCRYELNDLHRKGKELFTFLQYLPNFLAPPTTQPITTGPPETTARFPNSTSPTTPPNKTSASPTGPVASVSTPPDTTTPPPTTPPPPCNATRRTPLQEDRINALTFTIANYTIEEVCFLFWFSLYKLCWRKLCKQPTMLDDFTVPQETPTICWSGIAQYLF